MARGDTQPVLQEVLRNPAVWHARELANAQQRTEQALATTWPALDRVLPDGGWPANALTELLVRTAGAGELSLLLPTLRAICQGSDHREGKAGNKGNTVNKSGRGIALLAPPWLPHARAWESAGLALDRLLVVEARGNDLLWSAEQILRSGECGAVVLWGQAASHALNHRALQRLHLAAGTGKSLCFLYRSFAVEAQSSPAPLRLKLVAHEGGLQVHLIKCRGALHTRKVSLQTLPITSV